MAATLVLEKDSRGRFNVNRAAWVAFFLVFLPTAGVLAAATLLHLPWLVLLALPMLLGLAWVVHSPQVGIYAMFAGALLIGVQPLNFAASITDLPFWVNLNQGSSLDLSGFGISPAEVLLLATLVGLLARLAVARRLPALGRLMWPYFFFGVAVLIGEVNGLTHGGDFKLSLWELRPQVYGLAMFVMASLLIRDRAQLTVLLALLLVAESIKGVEGIVRYFIVLGQQLGSTLDTNQAHEDSLLLGLFLLALVIGLIWYRRPVIALLIIVAPVVFTAIVVNHRRAGLLGLGLEIVVAMVIAYIVEPNYRAALLKAGAVLVVLGVVFLATFWNQQYGSIAEVIRPIKSLFQPSPRDLSSDLYRIAETANLKNTFRTSPIIGIGFGHPYYIFYPQTGVAQFDPLWNIIPHNTVLWIPMRMGIIGMVAFWALISMAIIEAIWVVRVVKDKFIRVVVVFALAAMLGVLFNGYVDVGLESYRNMTVLGVLLAIISQAMYLKGSAQSRALSPQARPAPIKE